MPTTKTRVLPCGIVLGELYEDDIHKRRGTAIAAYEYLHGCTRVTIEWSTKRQIENATFDIGQLTHVKTGSKPGKLPQDGIPG